ncbi:hypothetical protein [Propionivibrio soli]|jgi:hypothetical protein|uniref:hypothetical protein n=1 Tax=Propionivibrio soli TaxID=2976531 RepID=UPI0021E74CE4|nr:hypothetical protein [Propionivibrio soli]
MPATIRIFSVGEKSFSHVMNRFDGSVELHDENDAVLLVYDAGAKVANDAGRMGSFHVEFLDDGPRWVFYETGVETPTIFGPDLMTAEVELSKRYLARA